MMAEEPKIEPEWIGDMPYCATACGSWEKHGRSGYCLMGEEPCDVCHPAVKQMAKRIAELPTDANGARVIPCVDPLWIVGNGTEGCMDDAWLDCEVHEFKCGSWWGDNWALWKKDRPEPLYWSGPVYTRRDTAEAALAEAGKATT